MNKPDFPPDEIERLNELRSLGVLDTESEERFDRLTRMAKRLFGVPIALVSLVDEHRQWFKSCFGLNTRETSRDISFCGHAILGNEVFIIPDAMKDERFANNPMVVNEPNIRFYAGCPLRSPNGGILGTLCIIDRQPRSFGIEDIDALKDLALMVESELGAVHLATSDELTKILNRRGFMMIAEHTLHLCERQNIHASLVFMDLDGFKLINDNYGHAEGDSALVYFAGQMKKVFRNEDAIARLGGDEFVALLTDTSHQHSVDAVLRLRKLIDTDIAASNRGYGIPFSYGIVEFDPKIHRTIEALLLDSDSQMYELKKSTIQQYNDSLN